VGVHDQADGRKYIGTVPNAKDVPIIKKRIEHLEKLR